MLAWSLVFLAAVLALIGLSVLAGKRLPQSHHAVCRASYRTAAQDIWETITDFEAMPSWRADLQRVERADERNGHPVWVEVSRQGRMPLEVEKLDPPRRMVTRIAEPKLPFGGTWTFELSEVSEGVTLTITEDGEIYNPIFRFMARYVFGYHGTLKRYLTALGARLGETIDVEIVQ